MVLASGGARCQYLIRLWTWRGRIQSRVVCWDAGRDDHHHLPAKRDHAVLISYLDQQARHVALPGKQFRWITFFSQAADKGRGVMIEYNERAAVSRIVIPALIEGWKQKQPERYAKWLSAIRSLQMGVPGALGEIETLLQELPLVLTLTELGRDYPESFAACVRSFPMLVAERAERPLQLQARALHHIGEVRRLKTSDKILESLSNPASGSDVEQEVDAVMRLLGALLDQSHAASRLYQGTPELMARNQPCKSGSLRSPSDGRWFWRECAGTSNSGERSVTD